MPLPSFTISGVLPPFVGPNGPGGAQQDLTPYAATVLEVVERFGTSANRLAILDGWLAHRRRLKAAGFVEGFQWLDGSFVEDKEPNDVDVVTFLRRPADAKTAPELNARFAADPAPFQRAVVKAEHRVDAFFVDMDAGGESVVDLTRYWLGLFSHRRDDAMWKGMVKVRLEEDETAGEDAIALAQALMAVEPPDAGADNE